MKITRDATKNLRGGKGFARAMNGVMIRRALDPTQVIHKIKATSNVRFYSLHGFSDTFIN